MYHWKTPRLKKLAHAIDSLKSQSDLLNFLRDLCTPDELEELSCRWEAAQLLNKGLSYREVAKKTNLSTTTVTRISQWLHHGEGGYQAALRKQKKKP